MFINYSMEDISLMKTAYMKKKENSTTKTNDPILDKLHEHVRLFNGLDKKDIVKLIEDFKVTNYKKGQKIYDLGNLEGRYYFVIKGCVSIVSKDLTTTIRQARSTQTFGEKYAMLRQPRPYIAVAFSDIVSVFSFKVPHQITSSFGEIFATFYKNVAVELAIRDKHND